MLPGVLRAEWACIGSENYIQMPWPLINVPVMVNGFTRGFRRSIDLAVDVNGQQPGARQCPVGAALTLGWWVTICLPEP